MFNRYDNYIQAHVLNELLVREQPTGKLDGWFRRGIWLWFTQGQAQFIPQEEIKARIDELWASTGIETKPENLIQAQNLLADNNPTILLAWIQNHNLYLSPKYLTLGATSKQLNKLAQQFKLNIIEQYDKSVIPHQSGLGQQKLKLYQPQEEVTYYHGTSTVFITDILKLGLSRRKNSGSKNYDIQHDNKIFITTSLFRAGLHAINSAKHNDSFPIIIELKGVPDKDKLVTDYDIAVLFYGLEHEISQKLGYTQAVAKAGVKPKEDIKSLKLKRPNLSSELGLFAYQGRISPSFITQVYTPYKAYETFYYEKVINYRRSGYYNPFWSQIVDIKDWPSLKPAKWLALKSQIEEKVEQDNPEETRKTKGLKNFKLSQLTEIPRMSSQTIPY